LAESVRQQLRRAETPGATVALVVDGQTVLADGIGARDLAGAVPLPTDAQCYSYSITKTLLAVIALQLVDQRRLTLDAAVQDYLPSLPLDTPVSVRQLLTHTAGLPDYGGMPAYTEAVRANPGQPWTAEEFLARTLSQGLRFAPGSGWSYSNIGCLIIRLLIKAITGLSLRAALAAHIVAPLGLRRTVVAETLEDSSTLVPGYSAIFGRAGALANVAPLYHPGWVSHGVVISTAPELARITEAVFTGPLLPADLLPIMLQPTRVPDRHPLFRQPAYGLGVMIDARSPYGVVAGHAGGGPGYSTAAFHFSNVAGQRVTSVALANRDRDDLGLQIAVRLAQALAGDRV
jgi:D-alanyl-D-alanine carboxypeptidase